MADSIERQRDRLAPLIPYHYDPVVYFGASNLVAAIAMAGVFFALHEVRAWEWLMVPAAFLVANWVEYRVHKGPMHHRRRPWEILFERHTRPTTFISTTRTCRQAARRPVQYRVPGHLPIFPLRQIQFPP